MSKYNPFSSGKAAFARGSRPNPTDDKKFMEYLSSLSMPSGEGSELQGAGRALREAKQSAMLEFKKGWLEARAEAEKPKEPVAKKKTKKKTSKKKVSKKKVSKKKSKK
jgi:hypothetical protein